VKRPQSNGLVERFHRTLLYERFRLEGRKTWFGRVEEMQAVLDEYLIGYNECRIGDCRMAATLKRLGVQRGQPAHSITPSAAIAFEKSWLFSESSRLSKVPHFRN